MGKKRETAFLDGSANWDEECEVKVKRNGNNHHSLRRMVPTRGVVCIDATAILKAVEAQMRQGYDVRLACDGKEAVRFYPYAATDLKAILVRIQPLGEAADWLKAKKLTFKHKGETLSARKASELAREQEERYLDYVTPDIMATCPKCGYEFRIGRPNKD